MDIGLTPLLSLPISAHYLYGKPADNVSGFGAILSLAYNWGNRP